MNTDEIQRFVEIQRQLRQASEEACDDFRARTEQIIDETTQSVAVLNCLPANTHDILAQAEHVFVGIWNRKDEHTNSWQRESVSGLTVLLGHKGYVPDGRYRVLVVLLPLPKEKP